MTAPSTPLTRMFLVGCPRSGTTLLQSLLAAHPDVLSFPETLFFSRVVPGAGGRRERLHLPSARAPAALAGLDALGIAPDPAPPRLPSLTVGGYARRLQRRLDRSAREAGATTWLEKTPSHGRHIDQIRRTIDDAKFIHLIREGSAVAASLKDAHLRDPRVWPDSDGGGLIALWQLYLRLAAAWIGRPGHAFVSYERLVADTEGVMRALCAFAGLRTDGSTIADLLTGYRRSSAQLIGRVDRDDAGGRLLDEPWKQDVSGAIVNHNDDRFERLFTEDERRQITAVVTQERATLRAIPFL